jgi:hypothetical protein
LGCLVDFIIGLVKLQDIPLIISMEKFIFELHLLALILPFFLSIFWDYQECQEDIPIFQIAFPIEIALAH